MRIGIDLLEHGREARASPDLLESMAQLANCLHIGFHARVHVKAQRKGPALKAKADNA
ncbi:hypothetical protein LE191_10505 [Janthinobacterium sp. HSC-3S05]|uniref:hypothetical protein n=1 Tax=Janthinobacterium lividum TaxID=29581 RepID=UPI001CD8A70B|nr:hypothetical protein [Janthinobacterium lividum]MCA1860532.1 hypothetical protein [Janthinobacterium lividum]